MRNSTLIICAAAAAAVLAACGGGPNTPPPDAPEVCGNGVVDPMERCDDGNDVDGDGCDSNCTPTLCGNGVVTAGEECDDGNQEDGDGCERSCRRTPPPVDVARSLFISPTSPAEQELLRARFPVSRIMKHILVSSGAARPADATELFQRWWDTQNRREEARFPDGPHCDDAGAINGFPVQCPRNEGELAGASPDHFFPVALVYRVDLTARDGSACGEARIVIAKRDDATGRALGIFETSIPNPDASCGLAGCRKIAQFWADLSALPDFSQRLDALERFYFSGLELARDGVATKPALDAANLGLSGGPGPRRGQIRTNLFMGGDHARSWQLREFKLARTCAAPADCKLFFEPVRVDANPWGELFNDNAPHPLGPAFRAELLGQVEALAQPDVNLIGMSVSDRFNAGQSDVQSLENDYGFHFGRGQPDGFRRAVSDRLAALGIALTPEDLMARATTQSCAGCHELSNGASLGRDPSGAELRWPSSAGFVHTRESGELSPALTEVFLPRRRQILEQLLRATGPGECTPSAVPDPTPLAGKAMVH